MLIIITEVRVRAKKNLLAILAFKFYMSLDLEKDPDLSDVKVKTLDIFQL